MKYRIISNGNRFRVQRKRFLRWSDTTYGLMKYTDYVSLECAMEQVAFLESRDRYHSSVWKQVWP
jgi:hypothetical protein